MTKDGAMPLPESIPASTSAPDARTAEIRAHELSLQRLLTVFIATGLFFLLLPGTFLGVWNLIAISGGHSAADVSPAWLQAHGHAQIFGWIGSFIIGIGFYSLSKMSNVRSFVLARGWVCWGLWTCGVLLRWGTNLYGWQWREMMPLSALMEISAFSIFFLNVGRHKRKQMALAKQTGEGYRREIWIKLALASSIGFFVTLFVNLGATLYVAFTGVTPAIPHVLDERLLTLTLWGFISIAIWGFSARWLPVFIGIRKPDDRMLLLALVCVVAAVIADAASAARLGGLLLLIGAVSAVLGLHVFTRSERAPKTQGIHGSFPAFVRIAYAWMLIAVATSIWALVSDQAGGIWGASRHALTVGFISTMVFSIGQRVLPAFCGMRTLFSPNLMFASLLTLNAGCLIRVGSEIAAYESNMTIAWNLLPVSAILEMAAVTLFALNLLVTLLSRPPHEARLKDPKFEGAKVLLADKRDGGPLSATEQSHRVIAPQDKMHARSIYSMVKAEVVRLRK
jgi:uncharacterized protein involved in response to NO